MLPRSPCSTGVFLSYMMLWQALGETALSSEGGSLPVVIVRPSIVVAAWREPLPGWLENLNGPTGIVAGAGKGLLRTVYCK